MLGLVARIFLLVATIGGVVVSHAAESRTYGPFVVGEDGRSVILSGEIGSRTATEFRRAMRENRMLTTLFLDSPGGDVDTGLAFAQQVFDAGLATHVAPGDTCASACSFVFFAGRQRHVEGRLGVHQFRGSETGQSDTQTVVADISSSLADFGVVPQVIAIMFSTPSHDMHFFTPEEVREYGIATDGSVPLDVPQEETASPLSASRSSSDATISPDETPKRPVRTEAASPSLVLFAHLDLYGGDVGMAASEDIGDCALVCKQSSKCISFTFNTETTADRGPNCFLKNTFDFVDRNAVAVSGIFVGAGEKIPRLGILKGIDPTEDVARDVSYAGGVLGRPKILENAEECRASCMQKDACEGFTHSRETGRCSLFGSISNIVGADGSTSGRKTAHEIDAPEVIALGR
jgi:ATP-dependent protease ClpP protease subunit